MRYLRYYIPDSTVFITQVVHDRKPVFSNPDHVALLRNILHIAKEKYPFHMLGYVFLPDHFHILIKPGPGITHSQIMHSVKPNFTKAYKSALSLSEAMHFWQRRYWDHLIRDDEDFQRHLDYIHYNPVKHGYVTQPEAWADSSFCQWRQRGIYPPQWGWRLPETLHGWQSDIPE